MTRRGKRRLKIGLAVVAVAAVVALFTASYYDPYNVCLRAAETDGMTALQASRHCNQQLAATGTPETTAEPAQPAP